MVMENATLPLTIASVFGSFSGNPIKPVGVLRLVVVGASYLKYPKGKGNFFCTQIRKHNDGHVVYHFKID